jgi:hypothetical protein
MREFCVDIGGVRAEITFSKPRLAPCLQMEICSDSQGTPRSPKCLKFAFDGSAATSPGSPDRQFCSSTTQPIGDSLASRTEVGDLHALNNFSPLCFGSPAEYQSGNFYRQYTFISVSRGKCKVPAQIGAAR